MRKISNFLSKPIISISNATFEGTIIGFLCEKKLKSIEYLCILVENKNVDEIKYIRLRFVKNSTENAVTILNNLCIKKSDQINLDRYINTPINSTVYNTEGKLIGRLNDIYFNDSDKYIINVAINKEILSISEIASASHDIVILYGIDKTPIRRYYAKKINKPKNDYPVEMFDKDKVNYTYENQTENFVSDLLTFDTLDNYDSQNNKKDIISSQIKNDIINEPKNYENDSQENNENKDLSINNNINTDISEITPCVENISLPTALENAQAETIIDKMPAKLISDYRFLLGRLVTNNIFDMKKKLIIKEGTVVNTEVVETARKNGKLIELTLSSKS